MTEHGHLEDEPEDLDAAYRAAVDKFQTVTAKALAASINCRGIDSGERGYWAKVIFLRLVLMSRSIGKLCPEIKEGHISLWWDFASIASLMRTVFECLMFFRYFTERCGDDEWNAKLKVMQLHDCCERVRIFTLMKKDRDVAGFLGMEQELRRSLENNSYFQALNPSLRKTLEHGYRPSIPTLREIVSSYIPDPEVWILYQFLSNYTHSFPMSFYRTAEQKRSGPENRVDKLYFTQSIEWLIPHLDSAVEHFEQEFGRSASRSV